MKLVGTAGFKYADWRGVFYPQDLPEPDFLSYYAQHFPALELDYTYYTMPYARTMAAMASKVPENFLFCVKAHKTMTHEIPDDRAEQAANFHRFMEALKPLQEGGQLGCVLLQFPWAFKPEPEKLEYVRQLPGLLSDAPAVVEFRNSRWVVQETFDLLRESRLGFCCVDEPRLSGLMPPIAVSTSRISYVRFHGRNAEKWWGKGGVSERYNYLYTEEELREWVPKIDSLDSRSDVTYILFNNCHEGKAAKNARDMKSILGLSD